MSLSLFTVAFEEKWVSHVRPFQLWISTMRVVSAASDVQAEHGASIQNQHGIIFYST